MNLTIFNYEKCEAVSSQDFRIEEMKITARAAIGSANYQGDLSYIKDNEPKYLDFEKFKAMDEFLKTSENSWNLNKIPDFQVPLKFPTKKKALTKFS